MYISISSVNAHILLNCLNNSYQLNTTASHPQVCALSRPNPGLLDLHIQLLSAASAIHHLIHGPDMDISDIHHICCPIYISPALLLCHLIKS